MHRWIFSVIVIAAVLSGCAETKETTFYLQDLKVNSPITQPPIHITTNPEAGKIHIIPRISIATGSAIEGTVLGHTPVNSKGNFQVDTVRGADNGVHFRDPGGVNTYEFTGSNLQWNIPSTSAGLDVDLGLSPSLALALGASYASSGGTGLWSYRAGLGFRAEGRSMAWRIDFGWLWQEQLLVYTTIVTERPLSSSASTVYFYHDREKKADGSFYGALTLNSQRDDWSTNIFLQIGLTRQRISEYRPKALREEGWIIPPFFPVPAPTNIVSDVRGEFSATLVHVTPGVYFGLTETARVVCGVRFSVETEIENRSRSLIVSPVVQFDFVL